MSKAKPAAVTKTEAVRQALAQVGMNAPGDAVIALVKERFGHELSKSHYFTIKTALNKKAGSVPTGPTQAAVAPRQAINLDDIKTIKQLAARYGLSSMHTMIDVIAK